MNTLLKEFISHILVTEVLDLDTIIPYTDDKGITRKVKAKSLQRKPIGSPGKKAYDKWAASQRQKLPAVDTTKQKVAVDKKPVATRTPSATVATLTPPSTPASTATIQTATKNLVGYKGILDAIVGITEKGSAGAGTKESRAAEASVVLIVNNLLEKRKSDPSLDMDTFLSQNNEAIDSFVRQLINLPKSAINDTWANPVKRQVTATMSEIEKRFGTIEEVVWDNKEGRDKFGIEKQEGKDRSDLYVRLSDGQVIGVSLKKDGNVFLANQGYEKIMSVISEFAKSESTKKKIQGLQTLHKTESEKALKNIVDYVSTNKKNISAKFSKLQRTDIKDVESKDYDKYFDPKTNRIRPEVLESILSGDLKGDKVKLLTKSLAVLAKSDKDIEKLMTNLRQVDNAVTHKLIDLMNSDADMNETVKSYMLDVLDMPQMLSTEPFPGVSRVVTVYGGGNVDEAGNSTALFTDGSTLRDTFGFPEGMSQEEMTLQLSDKFIIDAEKDSRVGYIRLKTKNPKYPPPPLYFYPTVASLGVRARGLGSAGVFELYQQNAWTFTLANKNPNPESWTPSQRKTHAKDTLKFLDRQLSNEGLSKAEREEIQKDIEFYKGIVGKK
jgi:hypothetical protein